MCATLAFLLPKRKWLVNYWFWLFVILPPVLVFGVKTEENNWLRAARLVGAAALAAMFAKLALNFDEKAATEIYTNCLARIRSGERSMRFSCTTLRMRAFGLRDIFFDAFTWITNVGYVASLKLSDAFSSAAKYRYLTRIIYQATPFLFAAFHCLQGFCY